MAFFYDAEADRSRTKLFFYAVGQLFTSGAVDGPDKGQWRKDSPRWFVQATTPGNAIREVLERHGADIARRSCNATMEEPMLDTAFNIRAARPTDGTARILWVTIAEDVADRPGPFADVQVHENKYRMAVTLGEHRQELSFRWVRL